MIKRKSYSSPQIAWYYAWHAYLAAATGTAAVGISQQNKTLMVISVIILIVYLYKIRRK